MLNKATLIGRLGRDPEIRHPQAGKQIATFSIATSERYMDKSGERQEKTEWHKIVVLGNRLTSWKNMSAKALCYISRPSCKPVNGKIKTAQTVIRLKSPSADMALHCKCWIPETRMVPVRNHKPLNQNNLRQHQKLSMMLALMTTFLFRPILV